MNTNGQMSSRWAKGCMLMVMCVLSDLTYLPFLGGWRRSLYIVFFDNEIQLRKNKMDLILLV